MQVLRVLLQAPEFGEERLSSTTKLLHSITIILLGLTSVLFFLNYFYIFSGPIQLGFILTALFVELLAFQQLKTARIQNARRILVYGLWIVITVFILTVEGVRGSTVFGQFLVVFLSGVLVAEGTAILLAVLSILANYLAALLESGPGLLFGAGLPSLASHWALQAGYLLLAVGLVMLLARSGQAATAERENNEDDLLERLDELSVAKAQLEISERSLRRREGVLAAIRDAAELLLRDESLEAAILGLLADLGASTDVDRVYLYENYEDAQGKLSIRLKHEWVGDLAGLPPERANANARLEEIGFADWSEILRKDLVVRLQASNAPEPVAGLLRECGVQSVLAAPIFSGETWWGIIGFQQTRWEREWGPLEEDALRGAGSILGGALQRRNMQAELNQSELRYLGILQDQFDLICRFSPDGKLVFANDAYLRFFGLRREDLSTLNVWSYVQPTHHEPLRRRIASLSQQRPVLANHILTRRGDGVMVWMDWTERGVFDHNGQLQEVQSVGRDIDQEIRLRKQLEENLARTENLAMTDALTGLLNRRAIMEHAEAEWQRSDREKSPLSLILVDLDNLKKVNDTYGHLAGDQAISYIASVMHGSMRRYDWAGRWGGDEFLLILPGADSREAAMIAERLRSKVNSFSLSDGSTLQVRVSLGVASRDAQHKVPDLEQLLTQADQALYLAKQKGRDQVALAGE